MIVDTHAHAFPDSLAPRAMAALTAELEEGIGAYLDGTLGALLGSMDSAGIDAAVVASIATKPKQFQPILDWSVAIAGPRVIPFASVHPDDPELLPHLDAIAAAGLKGIKLHPYYQGFILDDERVFPLYDRLQALGLVLLCHTGFDIAYPRDRICDPEKIARVADTFPGLKLIASHLGAWEDWDEVRRYLLGRPILLDTAFVHDYLGAEAMRELLLAHPADRLLFGTDSPWADQRTAVAQIRSLGLPNQRRDALLGNNAQRLLGL